MRKMSATFMAGSNVHELSKPLSYRGLCSYDATYMVRNFAFVALVDPVHLPLSDLSRRCQLHLRCSR